MDHKERIPAWQLAVVMASGFMELGLYAYPRQLAEDPNRQYYLCLALAIGLGLLLAVVCAHLALRFPDRSVVQIMFEVLGRPLGSLAALWIIFFHLRLAGVALRYFGDVVSSYFLPRTPPELIMLLAVLAVVYVNWQGVAGLVRFVTVIFPPVLVLLFVAYLIAATRVHDWRAAFPTMRALSPPHLVAHTSRILYLFVGVESVLMLMPLVHRPKRPYLTVIMPVLANGLFLVFVLMVTLGVLGIELTADLENPGLTVLRILRLSGLLVERLGGMIALAWTALKIGYLAVRFLTVPMATAEFFNLSVATYRKFLVPVALIAYFLARWPRSMEEAIQILQYWIGPVGLAANLGLALLLLAVASLRRMGKST